MAEQEPPGPGLGRFVPGEGPAGAPLLFVGEQPGDQEDVQGRPFVGPAGQLFDRALADAGVDRGEAYVTNAVKRFHFTERGKRRIHEKPSTSEIRKERWWLDREIRLVGPRLVVALGATAVQALAGKALPINRNRGPIRWPEDRPGYITMHPSYLLRLQDAAEKRTAYAEFVQDLQRIGELAHA
jgi:DNA polymerase